MLFYLKNNFLISLFLVFIFLSFFLSFESKAQVNDSINGMITVRLRRNVEILALGDPTHTEGTITRHRIDLIKKLALQRDFKIIAFESNIFDMYKAYQKFLQTGENNDLFDGMYNFFPCQELIELFDFVKEQNAKGDSIIITGFDTTFSGENTFENLKNSIDDYLLRNPQLKTLLSEEEKTAYYESLYPVTHTGFSNLFVNKKKLKQTLLPYTELILSFIQSTKEHNTEEDIFLTQALKNILQLHSINEKETWQEYENKDINKRDFYMLDNMEFLREQYPNQKIILFGSTTHFYKDAKSMDRKFFQKDRTPFGEHLNKTFKDKYFFIAYSALTGTRKGAFKTRKIKGTVSNSVESITNCPFFVSPTNANYLINFSILLNFPACSVTEKYESRIMGHSYLNMQIDKVCDAIIFLYNCTPYTELGIEIK
jgi:erythromycin esterase-like protein